MLYPSWIEIPVTDLERAIQFYRNVFALTDIPLYDDPPMQIAVLLPSEKAVRNPGVSLVKSPTHKPADIGGQINFHVDTHTALEAAITQVRATDGTRYITLLDSEGNRNALSSYEPLDGENG